MPRPAKVTRDQIVAAAIRLVDRDGAAALTMSRIGEELGVAAMSLYNHIDNKEALLDAVAETILSDITVPSTASGWESIVRESFRSVRRVAHRHPALFPLVLDRVPHLLGEARLIEAFLEVMCAAGFDERTALGAFRILSDFTIGYVLAEARGITLEPGQGRLQAGS
ncbi:MAG TPA: TetR/AcrR family transcriptional regulator C-terminal domain-containing protein, partial [Thermomicrobiaceae bacterium]|nr:TetR/AcrR family transcriptional regulator C-terminal domain-containing protein [Thermomicrobiaceae bacterium]